jgi:hypothetical protein
MGLIVALLRPTGSILTLVVEKMIQVEGELSSLPSRLMRSTCAFQCTGRGEKEKHVCTQFPLGDPLQWLLLTCITRQCPTVHSVYQSAAVPVGQPHCGDHS